MGEPSKRRRKGSGGLYIIQRNAWNEVKQTNELVEFYQASKDIEDPENPDKRKRITGTGRSPQEANNRLNRSLERFYKKRGLAEAGVVIKTRSRSSQRLYEYFDEWYSELRPERVSETLKLKYKQHFQNHILPDLGRIYLEDLKYQDLQKLFYETLPAKKKIKGGKELDEPLLGTNAILNIYRTLNVALHVAVKKDKISKNPLALVDTPQYKPPKENIPQMVHIVDHMFNKMNEANDPLFDHFLLALLGLRRGERLGLTFSAINLVGLNPKLTIRSQLTRISGKGIILKPATKSGKDRSVALIDPWLSSLKRMKEVRKDQQKLPGFKPDPKFKDLVFLRDDGSPYDLNYDNALWDLVNKTYNSKRPKIRGHAVRHCAATKMADAGITRDVAMAILGHESESMSFYYGRMTAKGQASQIQKFGEAITSKINFKK
jgi:integrase